MAESSIINPLGANGLDRINEGIKRAEEGITATNKAISAGVDTGDSLAVFKQQRERFIRLKQTYFPNS